MLFNVSLQIAVARSAVTEGKARMIPRARRGRRGPGGIFYQEGPWGINV